MIEMIDGWKWCDNCNSFYQINSNIFGVDKCNCSKYYVWSKDDFDEDLKEEEYMDVVYARDEESAVERWAEEVDCGDYFIVSGNDITVCVYKENDKSNVAEYVVSGESVLTYSAKKVG